MGVLTLRQVVEFQKVVDRAIYGLTAVQVDPRVQTWWNMWPPQGGKADKTTGGFDDPAGRKQ